jgi:hypothetical protein
MGQTDESTTDLVSIVSNNVTTRNPPTKITVHSDCENQGNKGVEKENDEDDDDDDDSDDIPDDDVFVDATGASQDDIEKEKTAHRLSKRLSGGHFGSAGGLMMSIMEAEKTQRRRSRPPPEDVAQSMLNWKRHSGQHKHENVPSKEPEPIQPEILLTDEDKDDPKTCASKLWQEDASFVQRDRIAEWLGQRYTERIVYVQIPSLLFKKKTFFLVKQQITKRRNAWSLYELF